MPSMLSVAVIGVVFTYLFNHNQGVVNSAIRLLGGEGVKWFSGGTSAMIMLMIASIWQNFGINMLFFMTGLQAIPPEMYEAASIDGASKLRCCVTVVMPVAKPGLAVVLMQTFLSCWNEVLMARIFISDTKVQPLSVIPIRFAQTISSRGFTQEVMYAALVICLAPIVVFYVFAAKSLIAGLTAGAVKG